MEMLFYKNTTLAIVSTTHNSYTTEPYVQNDQLGIGKENRDVFYPGEDSVTLAR